MDQVLKMKTARLQRMYCWRRLNINTKKFHRPQCSSVDQMKEKNRQDSTMSYDEIIKKGYEPCGRCNPSREGSAAGERAAESALKTSVNAAVQRSVQGAEVQRNVQAAEVQKSVLTAEVKDSQAAGPVSADRTAEITYVVNTNSRKFHYPSCSSVGDMKEKNRKDSTKNREELVEKGFTPCKKCNP